MSEQQKIIRAAARASAAAAIARRNVEARRSK
ncbi:MAG: hypothetical protein ACJA1Z_002772 [Patiriisocius sp.]|jgi:hypothetical protein